MKINREKIDLKDERDIIVGMSISDIFCSNIKRLITDYRLFQTSYNRKLIKWILEYYEKHNASPKESLRELFYFHRDELKDDEIDFMDDVITIVEKQISTAKKGFSTDFYLNKAEKYLSQQSLLKLSAELKVLATEGDIIGAENKISNYKKVKKDLGQGLDPLTDENIIERIFEMQSSPLFTVPGVLGEAFTKIFRGDLMGIAGVSKSGKSFMLLQFAKYAILDRLKVAYFTLEMSNDQNSSRLFTNIVGKSLKPIEETIVPYIENGKIYCDYINKNSITQLEIEKTRKSLDLAIGSGGLRFFDTSTSGCTLTEIEGTLVNLSSFEDWIPDVVIIDYADILETESRYKDSWKAEDEKWVRMKREIAQKHNCFCISATQLNREALKANKTEVGHTAGSIGKFNHTSLWMSLTTSPQERKAGISRCTVQGRHDEYDIIDEFIITRCLKIGRPIIDSEYKSKISNYDDYINSTLINKIKIDS